MGAREVGGGEEGEEVSGILCTYFQTHTISSDVDAESCHLGCHRAETKSTSIASPSPQSLPHYHITQCSDNQRRVPRMPSTRSRLRQSQSESQSQSSSLESTRKKPRPKKEETFESLSTAVLPLGYTIKLATSLHAGAIPEENKVEEYVRGQEFLSDGIRRVGDKEGVLGDLVASRSRKRRRLNEVSTHEVKNEGGKDVLWYTASLRHACSCTSNHHFPKVS
jgi:hypothetical protein